MPKVFVFISHGNLTTSPVNPLICVIEDAGKKDASLKVYDRVIVSFLYNSFNIPLDPVSRNSTGTMRFFISILLSLIRGLSSSHQLTSNNYLLRQTIFTNLFGVSGNFLKNETGSLLKARKFNLSSNKTLNSLEGKTNCLSSVYRES